MAIEIAITKVPAPLATLKQFAELEGISQCTAYAGKPVLTRLFSLRYGFPASAGRKRIARSISFMAAGKMSFDEFRKSWSQMRRNNLNPALNYFNRLNE